MTIHINDNDLSHVSDALYHALAHVEIEKYEASKNLTFASNSSNIEHLTQIVEKADMRMTSLYKIIFQIIRYQRTLEDNDILPFN